VTLPSRWASSHLLFHHHLCHCHLPPWSSSLQCPSLPEGYGPAQRRITRRGRKNTLADTTSTSTSALSRIDEGDNASHLNSKVNSRDEDDNAGHDNAQPRQCKPRQWQAMTPSCVDGIGRVNEGDDTSHVSSTPHCPRPRLIAHPQPTMCHVTMAATAATLLRATSPTTMPPPPSSCVPHHQRQ